MDKEYFGYVFLNVNGNISFSRKRYRMVEHGNFSLIDDETRKICLNLTLKSDNNTYVKNTNNGDKFFLSLFNFKSLHTFILCIVGENDLALMENLYSILLSTRTSRHKEFKHLSVFAMKTIRTDISNNGIKMTTISTK